MLKFLKCLRGSVFFCNFAWFKKSLMRSERKKKTLERKLTNINNGR